MTTQTSLAVDVQIACNATDVPPAGEIELWATRAIAGAGKTLATQTEISVRVVETGEMQSLNCEYRKKDRATNVLSFPAAAMDGLPADVAAVLGDIVLCAAVVNEEAAEQGKSKDEHWAHLVVHGTLHLLGYDHETKSEAAEMESLEVRILTKYGLGDPYGESQ